MEKKRNVGEKHRRMAMLFQQEMLLGSMLQRPIHLDAPARGSHGDQTVWFDVSPAISTTHCTRSTTEESQPSTLTEVDILQIFDSVKKGLSDFVAGAQVSNTLPVDEEDCDLNSEWYIFLLLRYS